MNKNDLIPGKAYLHKRTTVIDGIKRQAERWIRCESITETGAVFRRYFEPMIILTDKQIREELYRE